jgi:hypothetical protein
VQALLDAFERASRTPRPNMIVVAPWAFEAVRRLNLRAPLVRAFRLISRGRDLAAARYACARLRELRLCQLGVDLPL